MSKILYMWVQESENEFIKGKGFNIGGPYFYKYDVEEKRLTCQGKKGYIEGFWGENISDLCSVVGINGAGKSTLLFEIMMFILKADNNKRIVVYQIEGKIFYTHNLEYEIIVEPKIEKREIKAGEIGEPIFVSNSMEEVFKGSGEVRTGIGRYILNDASLAIEGEKLIGDFQLENGIWDTDEDVRRNQLHTLADLKEIGRYENLDNLFKVYFLANASLSKYGMEKWGKVIIRFNYCDFKKRRKFLNKISRDLIRKKEIFFDELKLLFYMEIQFFYGNTIYEGLRELKIEDIYGIREEVKKIALKNDKKVQDMEDYFVSAANEIIDFHAILSKGVQGKDNIGSYFQIEFSECKKILKQIFTAVQEKKPSFLLRYFSFELEKRASGEDALIKLYSRIYWVFSSKSCRKNNILFIDEIDLYMHPKWQRILINRLVNDIGEVLGKNNKVQIIFTTHSPIILSDIPKANILFLRNEKGKCIVENNKEHKQTFGNNVHTLFLDSFFLDAEGTIGEYAEKKINDAIQMLRKGKISGTSAIEIKNVIECVGDPLINKKLMILYKEMTGEDVDIKKIENSVGINVVDSMILMLKEQIENLQKSIYDLEKMKNDKNTTI